MKAALGDGVINYDASGLADAIAQRKLSSEEVVRAYFERIDRLNEKYNALVTLDRERALQRAQEADRALAQGQVWGPLHGVPVTIKDALQTAGLRTTAGYAPFRDSVPSTDAVCVGRLKAAGAVVLGKANCAKLCGDLQTNNDIFGMTNNPWDPGRTSGGSSGGDAAAVALGLSPLGVGSDSGGSIRIPASYCGVYGFKPSFGKIPREGLIPPLEGPHREDSLTVVGPLARSVRDLKLCYGILSGESQAVAPPLSDSPHIAWTHRFDSVSLDDEVSAVLRTAFDDLRSSGANVEQKEAPFDLGEINKSYFALSMYEFIPKEFNTAFHRLFWAFESVRSLFGGGIEKSYAKLKAYQQAQAAAFERAVGSYDGWIMPATPSVAIHHQKTGRPVPLMLNGKPAKHTYLNAMGGFTFLCSLIGNPSVVIPVGQSKDGLPIAVQIIGKLGQDASLLRTAEFVASKIGKLRSPVA